MTWIVKSGKQIINKAVIAQVQKNAMPYSQPKLCPSANKFYDLVQTNAMPYCQPKLCPSANKFYDLKTNAMP